MRRIFSLLFILACTQASLAQLSGPLSGTLGPGEFHVVDTISVELGDSLVLMPGTTFHFDGPYPFYIHGTLLAEGTESDSIIFTTDPEANPDRWRGLRFSRFGSSGSQLAYCTVENALTIGESPDSRGGGISCDYSSPTFTNCRIVNNQVMFYGGGLYCSHASPSFVNCIFSGNSARGEVIYGKGGGVCCSRASPSFTSCIIQGNEAGYSGAGVSCYWYSSPIFSNCTINRNATGNWGGGVYCAFYSSPVFENCTISDNAAGWGGGLLCDFDSSPAFINCLISGNSAQQWGGGVECNGTSPTFINCTISGNSTNYRGGGVVCSPGASPIISSTIIAFSIGEGILFSFSSESRIEYCDIFGNSGGDIAFDSDDPSHGPAGIGEVVTTNANGDSCDTYFNIFLDPMFVDTAAGDYHLLAGSPCIDAGDTELPLDPDSTIADIGTFYFHQLDADEVIEVLPMAFALHPNWPNPFNPITNIRYDVPQAGLVSVKVFNILGQEVATLAHGTIPAGSHIISWDASHLPSGIYFCILEARDFTQVQKLVLVK
jgi:hypothetical protein